MTTPYMLSLLDNAAHYQDAIQQLLVQHQAQAVGNGYIDIILPRHKAVTLVRDLAQLPVTVESLTWWCLCTPASKATLGCPHGLGGPLNRYGEGWFSECVQYPFFEVAEHGVDLYDPTMEPADLARKCSQIMIDYINDRLPREPFFTKCLHPGLWLHVPDTWVRSQ
jgi:hypothetical protein